MYNIKMYNKIAKVGLDNFSADYTVTEDMQNEDAILVRSAALHDIEFSENLKAIARAGAGTNNVPIDRCTENGIVVFNTPGANANAVKELVILGLLISSRKVVDAIDWAKTLSGKGDEVGKLVEKGKSQFVGPEIKGKTLGVVGLGAIGALVANAAVALGMNVIGYDPFLSVSAAMNLSHKVAYTNDLDKIYAESDYITIHVPLTPETKGLVNADTIAKMKDGVRILNFARGGLVSADIIDALESGKVSAYVVDFPDDNVIGKKNVIAIPHLGASTPESEDNCAVMACCQVKDYLENGNIINSVNMPRLVMERSGDARICVIHKNVPAKISAITTIISNDGLNIENMVNSTRGEIGYTVLDVTGNVSDSVEKDISSIDDVIRVRVIK